MESPPITNRVAVASPYRKQEVAPPQTEAAAAHSSIADEALTGASAAQEKETSPPITAAGLLKKGTLITLTVATTLLAPTLAAAQQRGGAPHYTPSQSTSRGYAAPRGTGPTYPNGAVGRTYSASPQQRYNYGAGNNRTFNNTQG